MSTIPQISLQTLLTKLQKRLWIVLIISLIIGFIGFINFSNKNSYLVSTGINLELPALTGQIDNQTNVDQANSDLKDNILWSQAQNNQVYIPTRGQLNKYFYNQLSSVRIQKIILDKLGEKPSNGIEKKLIYDLVDNNSGYIAINYSTNSESIANKFNGAVKEVITNNILTEWNQGKSLKYQAQAVASNDPQIITQAVSTQLKIIPLIVSLIITSLIAMLVPIKKIN
jgi:hypothetical protein